MSARRGRVPVVAAVTAVFALTALSGCASAPALAELPPWPQTETALAGPGPWQVQEADVSAEVGAVRDDCRAVVERYTPQGPAPAAATPLVFAHGFLRDVAQHRDHARHIAGWGVPVYLVGHCSGGWTRPAADVPGGGAGVLGAFMRQVADFSGAQAVVYGGFSAGGRAARMAAMADPRTVGWLGLDPVDRLPREPGSVAFPMHALFAPAHSCNAQQVGRAVTQASAAGRSLEVAGSTHCHFESPSNFLCAAACGEPGDAARNAELRRRITTLATAFVRWRAGLDAQAPEALWQEVPGALRAVGRPRP